MEFIPAVEITNVEAQGTKYTVSTSSVHEFIPTLVGFSVESTRIFKMGLTSNHQYYSRTKAIQKDDDDVLVVLSMIIGKD